MPQRRYREELINMLHLPGGKDFRYEQAKRKFINAESELGRTLFGEIKPGQDREFFCLEQNVWIWHENGVTMRYEVRRDGVFKKIDNGSYRKVQGQELEHFRAACQAYLRLIKARLYH